MPVAASLPVLAGAGYEGPGGPSPSVVGQKLVSSAEQQCIVPRSAGRAAFGVEEVNAAAPSAHLWSRAIRHVGETQIQGASCKRRPSARGKMQLCSPAVGRGRAGMEEPHCSMVVLCLEVPAGSQPGLPSPKYAPGS